MVGVAREQRIEDRGCLLLLAGGRGRTLSRDGLLGAGQNGLGILRMAGLAWADE